MSHIDMRWKKSSLRSSSSVPHIVTFPPVNASHPPELTDELEIAIYYHERNELESAAYFLSIAANNPDQPLATLLYGIALRSGHGVKKNEKFAFELLRRASDSIVQSMNNGQELSYTNSRYIPKGELALVFHEVGQCFSQGWGVKKDIINAVQYFQIASSLGETAAMQELGQIYLDGRGIKQNKKEAAKWFRAASREGRETFGMHWIWKDKYN